MTSDVSIKEDVLARLKENLPEIRERFFVDIIGIFGSVSRGEDTAESDVNVLYKFSEEKGHMTHSLIWQIIWRISSRGKLMLSL